MPKAVEEKTVTISKFKATCLAILGNVKKTGRSILVTRRGEPYHDISSIIIAF